MQFRNNRSQHFEVFSSSFSDIMFFLMLFFLIASTMITPGAIKLNLPQADKSPSLERQSEKISITITKDRKYYINERQVPYNQLEAELMNIKKNDDKTLAVIKCDNTVEVQSVVDVVQLGYKTGVKMVLATTKVSSKN